MKHKIIYGLFLFVGIACVSEYDANISFSGKNLLVVDGHITANSTAYFNFSKSFALNETNPPEGYDDVGVNLVVIGDNGYRSAPAMYQGHGVHRLEIGDLDPGVAYGIEFEYEGETYQSTLTKPLHTSEIDSVSWVQTTEYGDVTFRVSTHDDSDGEHRYYLWNYKEDWEIRARYLVEIFYNLSTHEFYKDSSYPVFYCWKNSKSTEFIPGTTEALVGNRIVNKILYTKESSNDRFSYLYSVQVIQRAVSKAAYEYYLDRIKSNEDMGGLFTPQPSEVEGNITCITNKDKKVIGFVDVAQNETEKRIYVSASEILGRMPHPNCDDQDMVGEEGPPDDPDLYDELYRFGYRPAVIFTRADRLSASTWARKECTDCREMGGKKIKPGFWPNNHQ